MLTVYLDDPNGPVLGLLRRPGPYVGSAFEFHVMEPLPLKTTIEPGEELAVPEPKRYRIPLRNKKLLGDGHQSVGVVDIDTAHELFDLEDFDPV